MKKIFLSILVSIPMLGFAQEIGSAGKILHNESESFRENLSIPEDYLWDKPYDLGYSEVFIRIPEVGRFTIQLGEQEITNSNGLFRFFDVPAQPQELSIYHRRRLLYRVTLIPNHQTRMLLDFFSRKGLFLLEEKDLRNIRQVYYGREWNNVWNHYYSPKKRMNTNDFNKFWQTYKRRSFDSDKLNFFRMQKNHTIFTTEQVGKMMSVISFDENKLELAKEAYPIVIDPENYYLLYEKFTFESDAEKFRKFIEQQPGR